MIGLRSLIPGILAVTFLTGVAAAQLGWSDLGQGPGGADMQYDSQRDRVVHLAGGGTYEFDGSNWTLVAPAAQTPSIVARGMAYDAVRQRTVLHGSYGGTPETWEWDGLTWRLASSGDLMSRIAWHSTLGRVVGFGGGPTGTWNWVYEWTGMTWNPIWTSNAPPSTDPAHPGFRVSYGPMAYDWSRGKLTLFGKWSSSGSYSLPPVADTWDWDPANGWIHLANAGGPATYVMRMEFDAARSVLTLLANDYPGPSAVHVWRFWAGRWVLQQGVDSPQYPIFWNAVSYDNLRGRMLIAEPSNGHIWSFVPPRASYSTLAPGCPGSLGVPGLHVYVSVDLPWVGGTLRVGLTNLPVPIAFVSTRLAAVPAIDLTAYGMPGCLQHVPPGITTMVGGSTTTALLQIAIPLDGRLLGLQFYQQALVLSPGTNAAGLVVSDSTRGIVGL